MNQTAWLVPSRLYLERTGRTVASHSEAKNPGEEVDSDVLRGSSRVPAAGGAGTRDAWRIPKNVCVGG